MSRGRTAVSLRVVAAALVFGAFIAGEVGAAPVRRVILALYEGARFAEPQDTVVHRLAELPLNHLGLVVRYHDVRQPLPPISALGDVRGVITWFQADAVFADPARYDAWTRAVIASGRRFVVMGSVGIGSDLRGRATATDTVRAFFQRLGVDYQGEWTSTTYDVEPIGLDRNLVEFERPFPTVLPPFDRLRAVPGRSTAHVTLRRRGDPSRDSHPVITGDVGGVVASGYSHYESAVAGFERRQWYVNPFEFFRRAFATDDLPKPDPTTVSGRRIFYSHVDGDGWYNATEIEPYRREQAPASRVILGEIIDKYRDLPVTIGPVVADLDPRWRGTDHGRVIARDIFSRSNVEASTHTYTHPLDWRFFERYDRAKEAAYVPTTVQLRAQREGTAHENAKYRSPRSYTDHPFDLQIEIAGGAEALGPLLPPGKRVELIQWSGDTRPFPGALQVVRRAGIRQINGGDSRFDRDYPSYAWLAPIGRPVGTDWQIYSSSSNENTYTELWTGRFFGYAFLARTVMNTELPFRVKPFNVYYHVYSGAKLAALNAVKRNLDYARTQQLAPVTASRYAAIADGFFAARLVELGPRRWRVLDRGALSTIRFDRATRLGLDHDRCVGVLGARYQHGSLYVSLDEAVAAPVIALRDLAPHEDEPPTSRPLLEHARWRVWQLEVAPDGWQFRAQGFGPGEFTWRVAPATRFRIVVGGRQSEPLDATSDRDGVLSFSLRHDAAAAVDVRVSRAGVKS